MTVIATLIDRYCTAHATDSFITSVGTDGKLTVDEDRRSKLLRVPAYSGIVSYWGLAKHQPDWDTFEWLRQEVNGAQLHASPETFANHLASSLNSILATRRFARSLDKGIGLHFTAYEFVQGYWIPELFLIRNWLDDTCTAIRPNGFEVRREMYGAAKDTMQREQADGTEERRLFAHQELQSGKIFSFSNGDPILFNTVAKATFAVLNQLQSRGAYADDSSCSAHLNMVRRPVDFVSKLLSDFSRPDMKRIGGKSHDLAVQSGQRYESTTGD